MTEAIAIEFSQASRKAQRWIPVISLISDDILRDWSTGREIQDLIIGLVTEITRESRQAIPVLNCFEVRSFLSAVSNFDQRVRDSTEISAHHAALNLSVSWQKLLWNHVAERDLTYPENDDALWMKTIDSEKIRKAVAELKSSYNISQLAVDLRTAIERERAKVLANVGIPFIPSDSPAVRLTEPKPLEGEAMSVDPRNSAESHYVLKEVSSKGKEVPLAESCIFYHGDMAYSAGGSTPLNLTDAEHSVLQTFLNGKRKLPLSALAQRSGIERPDETLRKLETRYGGIFAPHINRPGGRGRGGYFADVRSAESAQ